MKWVVATAQFCGDGARPGTRSLLLPCVSIDRPVRAGSCLPEFLILGCLHDSSG